MFVPEKSLPWAGAGAGAGAGIGARAGAKEGAIFADWLERWKLYAATLAVSALNAIGWAIVVVSAVVICWSLINLTVGATAGAGGVETYFDTKSVKSFSFLNPTASPQLSPPEQGINPSVS